MTALDGRGMLDGVLESGLGGHDTWYTGKGLFVSMEYHFASLCLL